MIDRSHPGNVGAEQAYCPACELKHVRQPDWLCPRCGTLVETEAWRSTMRATASEPARELEFPRGSVVAGAVLALTGVVVAIGFARHPVTEHRWPLVVAAALLLVLGIELLLKVSPARWVVIAGALIALIVVAEDLLRARVPDLTRDPLPPALRIALQELIHALYPMRLPLAAGLLGGTLLLVAGRPGRARIAVGVLVAAPLAVAEIVRWFVG
jgi:hypothetical protein